MFPLTALLGNIVGIKLHSLTYPPNNMLALCWHNTLAYYAFYYAGIFDAGLFLCISVVCTIISVKTHRLYLYKWKYGLNNEMALLKVESKCFTVINAVTVLSQYLKFMYEYG